jgi:hypothetical protein
VESWPVRDSPGVVKTYIYTTVVCYRRIWAELAWSHRFTISQYEGSLFWECYYCSVICIFFSAWGVHCSLCRRERERVLQVHIVCGFLQGVSQTLCDIFIMAPWESIPLVL